MTTLFINYWKDLKKFIVVEENEKIKDGNNNPNHGSGGFKGKSGSQKGKNFEDGQSLNWVPKHDNKVYQTLRDPPIMSPHTKKCPKNSKLIIYKFGIKLGMIFGI